MIERQLTVLRQAGVRDIVIATGYRHEQLDLPATAQIFNPEWSTTNMVATLFCAETRFGRDVVVAYGDIVYESRVLAALVNSPHDISVVVDLAWRRYWEMRFGDPLRDAESLRMRDGQIFDIGRRVLDLTEIEAQYIGLMRFRGPGLEALKAARAHLGKEFRPWMAGRTPGQAYMTDLLMEMVTLGFDVRAVPISGGWLEIDTVGDYEETNAMFADGSISRFFDPGISEAS